MYLAEVDAVAKASYASTLAGLVSANPPTGDSFFARLQHKEAVAQQAREPVFDDVLVRPGADT